MPVLVKLSVVTDFIKENPKAVYFKILDTDQKSVISSNSLDITPEQAIEKIEQTLANLTGEYVHIQLSEVANESKNIGGNIRHKLHAKVELENKGIGSGAKISTGNNQPDLFQMFLMQMQENRRLELQLLEQKFTQQNETNKGSAVESIAEKILSDEKLKSGLLKFVETLTGKMINGKVETTVKQTISQPVQVNESDPNNVLNELNQLYPRINELLPLIVQYEKQNTGSIENLHNMITGSIK
jgi:hypothetical protein